MVDVGMLMNSQTPLRLTWEEKWEGQPAIIVQAFAAPVSKLIEHAGYAYHQRALCRQTSRNQHQQTIHSEEKNQKLYVNVEAVKRASHEDYYGLLGIGHLALTATNGQIRTAYRRVCLEYHPDKSENDTNTLFRAIQTSYDCLMDSNQRAVYDSELPFDDSIGEDFDPDVDDFFNHFTPIFERNSIFSIDKPVPILGAQDTPYEVVDKFYDFWLTFKSWREFKIEDDYDLEEDASREERRWVERQRAKLTSSMKKEEVNRVRNLIEFAMSHDPRVKAEVERLRLEKELKKQRKKDAKRKRWEEKQRELEEERKKEQEEKERLRLEAEEEQRRKGARKKAEKKMRKTLKNVTNKSLPVEDIKFLVKHKSLDELQELVQNIQDDYESGIQKLNEMISCIKDEMEVQHQKQKAEIQEEIKEESPWTPDEITTLRKAVARFPGGTQERWIKVRDYLNSGRTVDEVMSKAKELKRSYKKAAKKTETKAPQKTETKAPQSDSIAPTEQNAEEVINTWSVIQQKQLEQAMRSVPRDAEDRWSDIAQLVDGKSREECIGRFKEIRRILKERKRA